MASWEFGPLGVPTRVRIPRITAGSNGAPRGMASVELEGYAFRHNADSVITVQRCLMSPARHRNRLSAD